MVLIIDIETTGLRGSPIDRVLEIGICEYDEMNRTITPVYSETIRYDDMVSFRKDYESSFREGMFIYENGYMTVEENLNAAKDLDTVVEEVRKIVRGDTITSYNTPFDFNRFLYHAPWELNRISIRPFDIMDLATEYVRRMAFDDRIDDKAIQRRLLNDWDRFPEKWIRSLDAYRVLCPDDPMGMNGVQSHRALDDAIMEAHILDAVFRFRGL